VTKIPDLSPIESSMFSGHHYDPATRQLTVQFKKDGKPGAVHVFDDVPIEKHDAFTQNQSPGRYFNGNIKSNFASQKIAE
jgi:KTSC domain